MRTEATIEQWKDLYEVATRIKELKPWENFWDLDIICLSEDNLENAAYVSILGKGGGCYGIAVYEGYKGFNDFLMLTMQERMNLSVDFAMFSQNNLTCYWGNREELSTAQRNTIKELGYKYRGKNQWLYFMSFAEGYYPYNMDKDEVLRMTQYLETLEEALIYYKEQGVRVDFEEGNMYLYSKSRDGKEPVGQAAALPFNSFQFGNLVITDEELLRELKQVPGTKGTLEVDIVYLGARVDDKKYKRPGNPRICILADHKSGMILKTEMVEPDDDANVVLAEELMDFIFSYGRPKELWVRNIIVEAALDQICDVAGISLKRARSLPNVEEFIEGMRRF